MTKGKTTGTRRAETELTDAQIEAIVADAIAAEDSAARTEATPPSSAIVWWRAQMRARREAAQLADKPIAIVHAIAIACGAGVALALIGVVISILRGSVAWLADIYHGAESALASLASAELSSLWLTLSLTAMIVSVIIVSVAAVFVLSDE